MWTSEKPTSDGWYWWRKNVLEDAKVLRVTMDELLDIGFWTPEETALQGIGEWAGPILPPS